MTRLTAPGASGERPSKRASPWRASSKHWWRQYGLKTHQHCLAPATAGQGTSFQACAIGPPQTSNVAPLGQRAEGESPRLKLIVTCRSGMDVPRVARVLANATSILASDKFDQLESDV